METEHGGGSGLTARVRGDLSERTLRAAGGGDRQDPRAGHAGGRHGGDAEEVSGEALPGDYFATARLTRQQARDSALSLLQEASGAAEVDEAAAAEAAQSIQTLAAYTLAEAQIENMITAEGYTDCVVFMADDGVSVVVSAGEDGLQTEDIAKITDIVKQETELTADCIKMLSKLAVVICGKRW